MPTPTDPARLAVQAALERNIGKVFAREQRVRDGDPDGLRKLRIAARRVRSDLATFGPLLDPDWAAELSSDLQHLADQLGAARDREVVLLRLQRGIADLPPGAPADQTLAHLRSMIEPGVAVDPASDGAWHTTRIRAKRARYAAEACIPVFGEISAEACLELGALRRTPAPAALGLGLLHGVQRQAVLRARAHFVALWPGTTELAATHQHLMREGASSPT